MKYYKDKEISLPACSLYDLLRQNNYNHQTDIALNYYDHKFTYGQLLSHIEVTEKAFWQQGIRAGEVVAICSVNTPEIIYSLYALNHIGAIVNLLDPRSPLEHLRRYFIEGNTNTVVCIDLALPHIEKAAAGTNIKNIILVSPDDSLKLIDRIFYIAKFHKHSAHKHRGVLSWKDFIKAGQGTCPEYPDYKRDRPAIWAHTGGTTGNPKTVVLSADNLNSVVFSYHKLGIPFTRKQRYFNDLPPFIIYGLTLGIHTTLCYGQEVILYPIFDSKCFPKLFYKYKPNHFSALSDHLKYLIQDPEVSKMDLSFLISAGVGGDSLNKELEEKVNVFLNKHNCNYEVCKGYGMSELGATAIISFKGANALGSVGIPLIINNVKVMDTDANSELLYGQHGEIWINGPSIMLGYLNKNDETKEIITIDSDGKRWLHTGDIGYVTEEGLVFIEGRIRRMYLTVSGSFPAKIYPSVIENAFRLHPEVYDCCAVGRSQKNSTYYEMVVFVVRNNACMISEEQLTQELFNMSLKNIPEKMQPVEIRYIKEIPHTPVGKVDFRSLENLAKKV